MGLIFWDSALRGGAVTLFLLLSFCFARDWRRALAARLGTLLTLSAACYVSLLAIDAAYHWPWWRVPVHIVSLSGPPLFWLFASSWFDDEFVLKRWHVAVVLLVVACGAVGNYLFTIDFLAFSAIGLAWRGLSIVAVGLALHATLKGRDADLVEVRRRVRLAVAVVVALFIVWIVVAELGVRGWPPPDSWRVGNALGMFTLAATVALSVLGWRDPTLVVAPARPAAPVVREEADESPLLARLDADMRRELWYRQDALTITAVAARLGVPEYRLRRAINSGSGARNFNAYLNGYRLNEARAALADPEQRAVPILTIAMDAGFGSLAPFNRAFRAAEGCTPTEYRARALRD